ncbi:hypothetical protein GCM10023310_01820 [Paenibacillus vulneris]|uniref:Glycosyltransferase n=1 Tax=Paenibacillus vulneris TaxID=1133364 RepID=A0ABW3UIE2_9BACL
MDNITLVVINENAEEYCYGFFKSLNNCDYKPNQIVFIDNASIDRSVDIAQQNSSFVYQFKKKTSKAELYKKGIEIANNNFIIFCHSDILFDPKFFHHLRIYLLESNDVDFVNFTQLYVDGVNYGNHCLGIDIDCDKINYKKLFEPKPENEILLECSESCFMVNKIALNALSFDSRFINSFCEYPVMYNIRKSNGSVKLFDKCIISHYFIELHEQLETNKHDEDMFIKNYFYIFDLEKINDIKTKIKKLKEIENELSEECSLKNDLIMNLNKKIQEISEWVNKQQEELENRDSIILNMNQQISEVSDWAMKLQKENAEKDNLINELNEKINSVSEWAKSLQQELNEKEQKLTELNAGIDQMSYWSGQF